MVEINPQYVPASFYNAQGQLTVPPEVAEQVQSGVLAKLDKLPALEQQIFLALLQSADVAPNGPGQTMSDVKADKVLSVLNSAMDVISSGMSVLDTILKDSSALNLLGRAMIEMAAEQRKAALDERLAAREAAKGQMLAQAADLNKAGSTMIATAIVSAVIGILGSVVSFAGAAKAQAKMSTATTDVPDTSTSPKPNTTGGSNPLSGSNKTISEGMLLQQVTADLQKNAAISKVFEAISGMISGIGQGTAKKQEADASVHAAYAETEKGVADLAKEVQQGVEETLKAVINFLKEMGDAKAELMRAFKM
ncbi:hypothetical protein [Prosthecomicrobium hirschii]|uniref:Uncharacterized protein n=2 Tax=Prosthecodimorpha hirschii TaxID=665126 RepID=A0A0P6WBU8_9HYPH|nr:hypothetical protein [Prosthecomicrobium hirschii]KPL52111.1 hypothetical protein ABB55_07630 [Prosthecomicrobium hirschii]MCW1843506.1 hypothetical protein [Prosthecomicrobium hirschii]